MSRIASVEELRAVLGEPRETTKAKLLDHLDDQAVAFLEASPFLLLATRDAEGRLDVSPKGDEAGFARVEDRQTIVLPERSGNNLAFGLQNILRDGQVGLIALRPGTGETLRINGRAEIHREPELEQRYAVNGKPALLILRIRVERAFFHCAKSVIRAHLWQPETWSPRQKISFGRIIADRTGGNEDTAQQIDERVAENYRTGL